MSRVIFVGVHNKKGRVPLCSSTKSGKLINRIINEGAIANWQKTNLFDVDYFPANKDERNILAFDWISRIEPTLHDIIVLLGVYKNIIKIAHPASKRSHDAMNEYVKNAIEKISQIKKPALMQAQ